MKNQEMIEKLKMLSNWGGYLTKEEGEYNLHVLPTGSKEALEKAISLLERDFGAELTYPYNLIDQIFGYTRSEGEWDDPRNPYIELTKDQEDGLEYALSTLTEREQKVLMLRFKDGLALAKVGKEFGVTTERVRQVEAKALRRLRHPARSNYIRYGYQVASGNLKERERKAHEKELEKAKAYYMEQISSYYDRENIKKEADIPIKELGLSVRAYNCLNRAGITTLIQLLDTSNEELLKTRNLGRHSFQEICDKLDALGYRHDFHFHF